MPQVAAGSNQEVCQQAQKNGKSPAPQENKLCLYPAAEEGDISAIWHKTSMPRSSTSSSAA